MVSPQKPVPPVVWICPGGKVPLMIPLLTIFLLAFYCGICVSVSGHHGDVFVRQKWRALNGIHPRWPSPCQPRDHEGKAVLCQGQSQGRVSIRVALTVCSVLTQGLVTVPARCFTQQMSSVSCKTIRMERRINNFDCLHTSNRESHPDSSHWAKITTAKLKISSHQKRCSEHLQPHMHGAHTGWEGEKSKIAFVPQIKIAFVSQWFSGEPIKYLGNPLDP